MWRAQSPRSCRTFPSNLANRGEALLKATGSAALWAPPPYIPASTGLRRGFFGRSGRLAGRPALDLLFLDPLQNRIDRPRMPAAAALRLDAPAVQFVSDGTKRGDASRADVLDQRRDLAGEAVRLVALRLTPGNRDLGQIARIAELDAGRLFRCQGRFGALRDQGALLLGEGRVQVEHKRVGITAELGDDERDPVRHQPRDKMHVAR